MTTVTRQPSKPISRVPILVIGAAALAFLDVEILARHLMEIQLMPLGFAQAIVRPILVAGTVFCLAALYIEGATPSGPLDATRQTTSYRVLALCLLGLALAFVVAGAIELQSRTEHWEDGSGSTSVTYPVIESWPQVAAFVLGTVATIAAIALPVIAMIAPPYIMRFGWPRLWPFVKTMWRHRQSYGWRIALLLPISLISWPARDFWMAGLWGQTDASTRHLLEIRKLLRWNNWLGHDGVALAAGIAVALFGLLLWRIGKAVGRALDTDETSIPVDVRIEVS